MEENLTQYSTEYILTTPEGLKLAVNALYSLQREYANEGANEHSAIVSMIRATDLAVTNGGAGNFYGTYDPQYLKPSASQVKRRWESMYKIIGKANEIIEAGKQLEDTPELRATLAQAYCFRAQSYFLLYRTYDRIWLNTIPTTAENVNEPRDFRAASEYEVFDLIYQDLDYAIANLGWLSSESGRFNQAAARHIKAKAALWVKDWEEASGQIDSIDLSGAYSLVQLEQVFNAGNLNHSEALLVEQWSQNPGGNFSSTIPQGNRFSSLFIAPYRNTIGGTAVEACSFENWGYTYGRCLPSPYLFSLYDTVKDERYNVYYIHKYKNTTDRVINNVQSGGYFPLMNNGALNRNVYPGCVKYGDKWGRTVASDPLSYKDIIVYRLAESYIIGAEAALMLGNQTKARYFYNKTWQRAGNNAFNGTLTMRNIMDEQARELAFEGDRWFFLKRLGLLIEQVQLYAGDPRIPASIAARTNLPSNPHFVRWPIPESEIVNMNVASFPQNPGY
jgi:hypothetical protein